jgi:hypothetical protein
MLDLSSTRWSQLRDAFGDGTRVPHLIAMLAAGNPDAIADLYASIYHQGSVYSASFAAVPHLVDIARRERSPSFRAEILVLVGSIATARHDPVDIPPEDVRTDCDVAVRAALPLVLPALKHSLEPTSAVYLLEVAAGLAGFTTLGRVLHGFIDEEFCITCPTCDLELYIWPTEAALETAAEDPVRHPRTPRTPIVPGPPPGSPHGVAYQWLLTEGGAALPAIQQHLRYLFGSGTCPSCKAAFSLLDELAAYNAYEQPVT